MLTRCSVLIIDDDDLSREVLSLLLNAHEFRVRSVAGGDEALRMLRLVGRPEEMPDVVLTDLTMPGVAGRELAARMRGFCRPSTLLVAMSAGEPRSGIPEGYDAFLRKPFSVEAFSSVIEGAGKAGGSGASASGSDAWKVLDEVMYTELASLMSAEHLEATYQLCIGDARARIQRMRDSAEARDDTGFRREAHVLQGGCGMLGALAMRSLAAELESSGIVGRTASELDQDLDSLAEACERLQGILEVRWRAIGE